VLRSKNRVELYLYSL